MVRPGALGGAGRGALILSGGAGRGALVSAPQRPCQPGCCRSPGTSCVLVARPGRRKRSTSPVSGLTFRSRRRTRSTVLRPKPQCRHCRVLLRRRRWQAPQAALPADLESNRTAGNRLSSAFRAPGLVTPPVQQCVPSCTITHSSKSVSCMPRVSSPGLCAPASGFLPMVIKLACVSGWGGEGGGWVDGGSSTKMLINIKNI